MTGDWSIVERGILRGSKQGINGFVGQPVRYQSRAREELGARFGNEMLESLVKMVSRAATGSTRDTSNKENGWMEIYMVAERWWEWLTEQKQGSRSSYF